VVEAGRFEAGQGFRRTGLELAEAALDANRPDGRGTRKLFARIDPLQRLPEALLRRPQSPKQQMGIEHYPHTRVA
jgi:hypothetical protein